MQQQIKGESTHVISPTIDLESLDVLADDKNRESLFVIFQLLHPILIILSQNTFYNKYNSN